MAFPPLPCGRGSLGRFEIAVNQRAATARERVLPQNQRAATARERVLPHFETA